MQDSSAPRPPAEDASAASLFPPTQWTVLLKPVRERQAAETEALENLFRIYRGPIVNFIRSYEKDMHKAEDIAHDFIAKLLRQDDLARLDRSKGQFRGFLLAAMKNFLANVYASERALKRGGRTQHVSVDELAEQLPHSDHAERAFIRNWVNTVNEEALHRLRAEWRMAGREADFDDYEPFIWEKKAGGSREALAKKHGISVNAVNVRIVRLRERHQSLMREVIGETVGGSQAVDEEIRLVLRELS